VQQKTPLTLVLEVGGDLGANANTFYETGPGGSSPFQAEARKPNSLAFKLIGRMSSPSISCPDRCSMCTFVAARIGRNFRWRQCHPHNQRKGL
jgi:hypothetical protein